MYSYIDCKKIQIDQKCLQDLRYLYEKYMNHEFDLLGSGFVKIKYGMKVKGFEGRRYVPKGESVIIKMADHRYERKISSKYTQINWFIDYKSGFLFHPLVYNTPSKCLKVIKEKQGVDIKCPWELGRFYHLLQLALLAIFDAHKTELIIREFKDELYDFMAMNPLAKTVQWSSVMDTAIRNVNLLIAYDILKQLDIYFILDKQFEADFSNLIYKGTQYIIEHLEYAGERNPSGNHYLSNLSGIAFAAAYLPQSKETDAWLVFAVQEMIEQIKQQFFEDGSNFEGSTSYHRLSTEFYLYTTALVFGVIHTERKKAFLEYDATSLLRLKDWKRQKYNVDSDVFFPEWYVDRLYKAGIFTQIIMKDNDEIVQTGDNDSGRLIKLTPCLIKKNENILEENVLDHSGLLAAMAGIYDTDQFEYFKQKCCAEYSLIRTLSRQQLPVSKTLDNKMDSNEDNIENIVETLKRNYPFSKKTLLYQMQKADRSEDGGETYWYKKFGMFVYRKKGVFVSIMIPPITRPLVTAHRHNDALAVEVMVNGRYITRDPGNYVYTSDMVWRDKFRSVLAHNTVHVEDMEQNEFQGIWRLKYQSKGRLLYCKDDVIIAEAGYGKVKHMRIVKVEKEAIIIEDYCNYPFRVAFKNRVYSVGYGKKVKEVD